MGMCCEFLNRKQLSIYLFCTRNCMYRTKLLSSTQMYGYYGKVVEVFNRKWGH